MAVLLPRWGRRSVLMHPLVARHSATPPRISRRNAVGLRPLRPRGETGCRAADRAAGAGHDRPAHVPVRHAGRRTGGRRGQAALPHRHRSDALGAMADSGVGNRRVSDRPSIESASRRPMAAVACGDATAPMPWTHSKTAPRDRFPESFMPGSWLEHRRVTNADRAPQDRANPYHAGDTSEAARFIAATPHGGDASYPGWRPERSARYSNASRSQPPVSAAAR